MVSENAAERRVYTRITYPEGAGARLTAGDRSYTVVDISQCGIRLTQPAAEPLGESICGTVTLLCGGYAEIEADLEWQENGEVGCSLPALLPSKLLERELRYVAVHFD